MTDPASLQNLHPIVSPPDVGLFPLAPGWYLVIILLLLVIARVVFKACHRWSANRYRREGLKRLDYLQKRVAEGEVLALRELPVLFKEAALAAYPRREIAGLYGDGWTTFINSTMDDETLGERESRLLQDISWAPTDRIETIAREEVDHLFDCIKHWLEHHRNEVQSEGEGT